MSGSYRFIEWQQHRIPFRVFGKGPVLLIAFHGFGRSADDFAGFEPYLGKNYTIAALDFFYHGPHADFNKEELPVFTPVDLAEVIANLLQQFNKKDFALLGYSFGGRLVLGVLPHLHQVPESVFLLASDGLGYGLASRFVTGTLAGQRIAKYTLHNPDRLFRLMDKLKKIRLLNEISDEFIRRHLGDTIRRKRVFNTWMTARKFRANYSLINRYVQKHNLKIILVFGRHDTVIPLAHAENFRKYLKGNAELHVLETGHGLMYIPGQVSRILMDNV